MADRVPHASVYALEEMIARNWRFSDLCRAFGADEIDRVALQMFFLVQEPGALLGEMAERLDTAFGVTTGFFQSLEDQWRADVTARECLATSAELGLEGDLV